MGIIEIWIPELIIVIFLALPLVRPFFKKLWPLDGLAWLPLIALGIAIGIFPAYGFRPECIPILIFTLFYNIANFSPRPKDAFRDRGPMLTIFVLFLLGAATFPMFAFASRVSARDAEEESFKTLRINNRIYGSGFFNREYTLQVYGDVEANRPLIFLFPPEMGTAASIELVRAELQRKNFAVITYTYKDTDLLRRRSGFPAKLFSRWSVFRNGTGFVSANEQGKLLETQSRSEIEFLLSKLPTLLDYDRNVELPPFLLVGYGASGSALAYLAGEDSFLSQHNNVIGVIAIESRLWSSYIPEPRNAQKSSLGGGVFLRQWTEIGNRLESFWPQKVIRMGPLPNAGIPVLYLVSGRALDVPKGQRPYQGVFSALRYGSGPAAVAAIEGAGPLDYQDFPYTHPIYSFFLPGLKDAEKSEDPIGDTAAIIGNFASLLLEQAEQTEEAAIIIPPRQAIGGKLYFESKKLPDFRR